jgi:hypothetical protein
MSSNRKSFLGVYRLTFRTEIDVDATDPVPNRVGYHWFRKDDVEDRHESWVTFTPDNSPDWIVGVRLEPDSTGTLVAAELRVFPREDYSDADVNTDYPWLRGEWSRAIASIPEGGIRARMLRSIRLGDHLRESRQTAIDNLRRVPNLLERLVGFGYTAEDIERWRESLTTPEVLAQGHGEDYPELLYARISALYVNAIGSGSKRPHVDVADQLGDGWTSTKVREWVRRARSREMGLLTETAKGVAGGDLTNKARRILDDAGYEEESYGED